jgi:hypothetical protein
MTTILLYITGPVSHELVVHLYMWWIAQHMRWEISLAEGHASTEFQWDVVTSPLYIEDTKVFTV